MKNPNRVYLTSFDQPEILGELSYFPSDPLNNHNVQKLRSYTKIERLISSKDSDFKQALAIAQFTSEAWGHDGFNSNPKKQDALTILKLAEKGASFACVQFASVFVQLCQSVGIPARVLQVCTKNPALGSSGHGHVTAEYFDNQLGKWVWIDPQIHAYAINKNIPLSFNELSEMIVEGKRPTIKFTTRTLSYVKNDKNRFKDLKNFIRRYVWSSRVIGLRSFYSSQKGIKTIGCKREGVLPAVTFQGFPNKTPLYVSRENFDSPLNSCQMQFETMEPLKKVEWKDLKDYKANAHLNFASSVIKITLNHSMPWFSHYKIIFNGKQRTLRDNDLQLKLAHGKNILEIYPVNLWNRTGSTSKATIHFDGKYKTIKNYW